jgi:hypothetical protein
MTKHEYQNPNQMTNDEASMAGARLQRVTQSSSVPIELSRSRCCVGAKDACAALI